jgi:uncharacterized RDD family membrane protein YckC
MVLAVVALGDLPVIGPYVKLFAVGFALFYLWFADGFSNGQSYGKRVFNTAVVDYDDGTPCTCGQSLVRNILLSVLGPIDWVFIFGEQRRRLGDRAAGTKVVELPAVS